MMIDRALPSMLSVLSVRIDALSYHVSNDGFISTMDLSFDQYSLSSSSLSPPILIMISLSCFISRHGQGGFGGFKPLLETKNLRPKSAGGVS